MNGTLIIGTVFAMDAFKPLEESENIRKRFELPSDVCVCGHKADSHWGDEEKGFEAVTEYMLEESPRLYQEVNAK